MFKKVLIIMSLGIIVLAASSYYFFKDEILNNHTIASGATTEKSIRIADHRIKVMIADEPRQQTQGLSGRTYLAHDEGMLFIFPQTGTYTFWMKDMLFALDMIWIDDNGRIIAIDKTVPPESFPKTFSPPSPIKYVLEVNAGWSNSNNVQIGDSMTGLLLK